MPEDKTPKLTPLELLKKRPMPVFDVVHGADNPGRKPVKAPPQKPDAAVRNSGSSLVRDIVPTETIHALETLKWRLERGRSKT